MKISFLISLREEKRILLLFSEKYDRLERSGKNLFQRMVRGYPKLENLSKLKKKEKEKLIFSFLKKQYSLQGASLRKKLIQFEKEWKKHEFFFVNETEKIFQMGFPNGNYRAYLTIFKIFPRNIYLKKFQVGVYKGLDDFLTTVMHEMLHFMFFAYMDKKFKNRLDDGLEWDLSEIINVILLNKAPYTQISKVKEQPYPNHKIRYKYLNKLYLKSESMDDFIEKAIIYLKSAPMK